MVQKFLAYELALDLNRRVKPMKLKYHLKLQLERAADSVVLNLAEGSAKPSLKDKKRIYSIAFGSVREVRAVFHIIEMNDPAILDLVDHLAAILYKLSY